MKSINKFFMIQFSVSYAIAAIGMLLVGIYGIAPMGGACAVAITTQNIVQEIVISIDEENKKQMIL